MIYTVNYFNPVGNCDNIAYIEADNDVDVALIAHAGFWAASKPFNLFTKRYKGAWQMYEGYGLGADQPVVPYIHPDLQGQS